MSKNPFMQIYWGDYFGKTPDLTCEQHGAYLQLIGRMWIAGGYLPNDPAKLARITGCTPSRWAKISGDVLAFFTVEGDRITHRRVTEELEKAREKSIKRADAGSRGGSAKSLKNNNMGLAIALAMPQHLSEPEPEKIIEDVSNDTSATKVKRPVSERGSRIPENWTARRDEIDFARSLGIPDGEIQLAEAEFRDYWITVPGAAGRKTNWDITFRNRLRTVGARRRPGFNSPDARRANTDARRNAWATVAAGRDADPNPFEDDDGRTGSGFGGCGSNLRLAHSR